MRTWVKTAILKNCYLVLNHHGLNGSVSSFLFDWLSGTSSEIRLLYLQSITKFFTLIQIYKIASLITLLISESVCHISLAKPTIKRTILRVITNIVVRILVIHFDILFVWGKIVWVGPNVVFYCGKRPRHISETDVDEYGCWSYFEFIFASSLCREWFLFCARLNTSGSKEILPTGACIE